MIGKKFSYIAIGLTIFSMFFGAGNSIFPLYVGAKTGSAVWTAFLGLVLTAVILPLAGVFGMARAKGQYTLFFGRLGKWPGLLVASLVIFLLGPLGSTPRCIALSHATLTYDTPFISQTLFSALSCILLFILCRKKRNIVKLIGSYLTPLLLLSLIAIIAAALLSEPSSTARSTSLQKSFFFGLKEGYNTMDLLAAFFFSSSLLTILKDPESTSQKKARSLLLKGTLVGGALLTLIYGGFCFSAANDAGELIGISQEKLLTALAHLHLGPYAALFVSVATCFACLTTAIALLVAFTDFVQKELFKEKISYEKVLLGATVATFFMSILEFSALSSYLGTVLTYLYPLLILLTLANLVLPFPSSSKPLTEDAYPLLQKKNIQ